MHVYREWFKKGEISDEGVETQARELVRHIQDLTDFSLPELSLMNEEKATQKFLLKYRDGLESESVILPMKSGITLCISSQIGCKMGCTFCQTGKMGLVRSLRAEEIVAQVFYALHILKKPVRNLVFMGMGEPLDNFEELMCVLNILTEPSGLGFGPSRITVSTSGLVDGIRKFMKEVDPAVNLAVSVNAPNDAVRKRLMPVNKQWDILGVKFLLSMV
jgi:23S rRNA (adenine2503-C2)-methyltransferase